ncbi:MAG: sigma-70 family RNA polymerase sigma factor, partial [Christensenellaceae bacterium]
KLIRHNMRLVAHVAKKYAGAADPDDILSVGSIGLIKAIDTYRPDKGTALATYTARCIENEILMLLRAGKKHRSNVSLTDPVGMDKDGNELTIMDVLAEEGDVFDSVENSILSQHLLSAMKEHLSEREFEVISLRYGFGCAPLPQREVAKRLGISRSYVSRIEKRAMEILRSSLREEDFLAD